VSLKEASQVRGATIAFPRGKIKINTYENLLQILNK
jgi:hypothetical protein